MASAYALACVLNPVCLCRAQVLTSPELRSERMLPMLSRGMQEALLQGYADMVDRLLTYSEAKGDLKRLILTLELTPLLVSKVKASRVAQEVLDAFKLFSELMNTHNWSDAETEQNLLLMGVEEPTRGVRPCTSADLSACFLGNTEEHRGT
eukprot:6879859-Prymnesium_polylepis.1